MNRDLNVFQEYERAKQRQDQTVQQFNAYLLSLESQLPSYIEEQRVATLYAKLCANIRSAIVASGVVPKQRAELLSLAIRLEANSGVGASISSTARIGHA